MHALTARHQFNAQVAREIIDKGATPEKAVETVKSRMSSDPVLSSYSVPERFLERQYPTGTDALARAKDNFETVAIVNKMSVEELRQHLGGGLGEAVKQAKTGVPPDLVQGPKSEQPKVEGPKVGLAKSSEPTPFDGWQASYYGREAMAFLLFPGFHSKVGKDTAAYKDTLDAISKGGNDVGTQTMNGTAIIRAYGEFSDWAMQRQGVPDQPPPKVMDKILARATQLENAEPDAVKKAIDKHVQPGGPPLLFPFEVPGHQTYASFEAHPSDPSKLVMRYFDRQRPDLDVRTRGGERVKVDGYLGASDERRHSTELCFEVDRARVVDGDFVDTMFSSVKKFDSISGARANMVDKLAARSERVYAATDSRPQIAQAGAAINCTWASFESFLSHMHGDQYKHEVASMREFIVDRHVVPQSGGFHAETKRAVSSGLEKALQSAAPGPTKEALLRAQQQLSTMK